jgi:translation initiation factor 4A
MYLLQYKMNNTIKCYNNFDDMKLKENLLRGIYSYGFEKPSVIQQKAIIPIINGQDIIAQAQSGTGKTGTFSIAVLEKIDTTLNSCQAIILSPSRELALQTFNVMNNLNTYLKIKINLCIGGITQNYKELKNNNHIVVGTPGRINNLIENNIIKTNDLKLVVIDEADEMLSYEFQSQIRDIIVKVPEKSQICLFSATISKDVLDLTDKFMNDPQQILIKNEELTLEGIKQFYIMVGENKYKIDVLKDLYKTISLGQTIIYVNNIKRVENLCKLLERENYSVTFIHGNMEQKERNEIMERFRLGKERVLITTDLLARGIDIQQVSVVINYDLPPLKRKDNYIHRIGRSGRYGKKGVAINFVTNMDSFIIEELMKFYNTQIEEMPDNIQTYL